MYRNRIEQGTRFKGEKPNKEQVISINDSGHLEAADNVNSHRTVKQTMKLKKISLKEADSNFILPNSKYKGFLPPDN